MDTKILAAGLVGFLLGGLLVSVAAEMEDDAVSPPHGLGIHQVLAPHPADGD